MKKRENHVNFLKFMMPSDMWVNRVLGHILHIRALSDSQVNLTRLNSTQLCVSISIFYLSLVS